MLRKVSVIGFSDDNVKRFQSYLPNRKFFTNSENSFSEISSILWGVQLGSTLGPFLFLIYVDDIVMSVKCNLFSHTDDPYLVFQSHNVRDIENQPNEDFANKCDYLSKSNEVFTSEKIKPCLSLLL